MSHFEIFYPECSQIQERLLLARIDRLPDLLQRFIGEFSPVVAQQAALVKYEFFDKWVIENTHRIMGLMDAWPKHHVGFVLNSILRLETRDDLAGYVYLKGESCYENHTAEYMRTLIKVYISYRTDTHIYYKVKNTSRYRYDLLIEFMIDHHRRYIPCQVNPAFDDCSPIRVYGAFKAIEEYDTRIKMKKAKKGKTLK